ncbi:MAG: tRNA (adenosine(37)-N6)-threonylcarbamoyltransferase complex ATPase subunit type 1 TsaE [bacterium]
MNDLIVKCNNEIEIKSIEEMQVFARSLLQDLSVPNAGATVLCLSGDLGAGKTTFTQQVANIFKITDYVTSPTFVLQKRYEITENSYQNLKQISQIIHVDMYRIEGLGELIPLGFDELLKDPKNLMIIEWPEKVADAIPANAKWIFFKFVDETTRKVQW